MFSMGAKGYHGWLILSATDPEVGWGWQPMCHVYVCGPAVEEEADTWTSGCDLGKLPCEQ